VVCGLDEDGLLRDGGGGGAGGAGGDGSVCLSNCL